MRRILGILLFSIAASGAERPFERLNRGLVVTRADSNSVAISWRLLSTDRTDVSFDLFRTKAGEAARKLNPAPIAQTTFFLDTDASSGFAYTYSVAARSQRS